MESAPRIDRRAARTRASLHGALVSLILEKGYDSITVEEICQVADVGRSTFYLHFTGKDDLKRTGLDGLRRHLVEMAEHSGGKDKPSQYLDFSLAMFEHASDHIELYRALAGSKGSAVALGEIREILSGLVRKELAAETSNISSDGIPRELVVQYVVGAFMAVLTWWLDGGTKLPPEKIDAMFRQLVSKGAVPGTLADAGFSPEPMTGEIAQPAAQ